MYDNSTKKNKSEDKMSKSQFTKAKEIFENRNEIIEKYTYFDSDREDFIKELKLDESNTAQFVVFLLMVFNEKNRKIKSIEAKIQKSTDDKVLKKIKTSKIFGVSFSILKNSLPAIVIDDLKESLESLILGGEVIEKEIHPTRGKTTIKYFYKDYLQN